MAQYTVQAPDGNTITLEGPEGATQEQVIAQAQQLYKAPAVQENKPQASAYQSFLESLKNPEEPLLGSKSSQAASSALVGETVKNLGAATQLVPFGIGEKLGNPMVETGQAMVEGSKQLSPVAGTIGQFGSYLIPMSAATKTARLLTSAPKTLLGNVAEQGIIGGGLGFGLTPGGVGERVKEAGMNAVLGGGLPVVAKGVEMVGKKIAPLLREAPSYDEMANKVTSLFKKAKDSGIQVDTKEFTNGMFNIGKGLREEGYTPSAYPKITAALEELTNTGIPKDYTELRALRKIIQGAQKSTDLEEKRLASILKSEFDDYVMSLPESSVTKGSKEGLAAWKEARDAYSKMSKSEVFTDMLERAAINKGKFSQSGLENALFTELRSLANNQKQMRMFSKEEQDAIREAAIGGNVQNALRFLGKFAPTSAVSSIMPLITTALSPTTGLVGSGLAIGARSAASKMRQNQVENLSDLMLSGGQKGDVVSRLNLTPTQQNLAKMLMLQRTTQGEQ
jgi:hypothetical protein